MGMTYRDHLGLWYAWERNSRWLPIRRKPTSRVFCPFCAEPVGWVGYALTWALGPSVHSCSFANVMHPQEFAAKREAAIDVYLEKYQVADE